MKRRTVLGGIGGGIALLGAGAVGFELFAPERATEVDEELPTDAGATVLKTGEFVGKANHRCAGTVALVEDAGGLLLQFREYEQTQGPDVFCFLTPAADPDTREEIAAGRKVLVDGGADGGEMTKTGSFTQRLPDDVDPAATNGVGIWCENFSTPFGAATLAAV